MNSQPLKEAAAPPLITNYMVKAVSQHRREVLEEETNAGKFRQPGSTHFAAEKTPLGNVKSTSARLSKFAQGFGLGSGGTGVSTGYQGSGGTVRQVPEVYSPLWLNSNLNLPRDRATINAWCRSFYALNPVVQNAIYLHATYPISKLNIKCKNEKVNKFFQTMIEEIDLTNICVQIAQEYWTLGEAFVYAELDERSAKWSRILIQNPDYISVKRSVIAGEPIISLRPDENLRRICTSNRPSDMQQRQQLDKSIVEHVRRGENIPLDNFYVSHIARRISPYEIRGTGLPVSCFRQLMLFDKLRESKFAQADNLINPLTLITIGGGQDNYKPTADDLDGWRQLFEECHDEETEVLTEEGFKKFEEAIEFEQVMDGTTGNVCSISARPKSGIKIACFNSDKNMLEYHTPSAAHVYDYDGDMYHFHNDKMDTKVTPDHKMWVQSKKFTGTGKSRTWKWGEWEKILAKDLYKKPWDKRFRAEAGWEGEDIKFTDVCGQKVPIELYLEFLGYIISEGHLGNSSNEVSVSQAVITKYGKENEHYPKMRRCVEKFAEIIGKTCGHTICAKKDSQAKYWNARFSLKGAKLFEHLCGEIGSIDGHRSHDKVVPKWILNLSPRLLQIFLDALITGDGSDYERPVDKSLHGYFYYTTSKQLADDVYEAAYKAGYVPTTFVRNKKPTPIHPCYTVQWSNSHKGNLPLVTRYSVNPRTKEKKEAISKVNYSGKVWCFTVPTGLFITRRNGKIAIHSNCQYDKDFKLFTHDGVKVEYVSKGAGIYDISGDITQLLKEIYIGLMVPQVIMDGGADVTYANGGVALDVLRQRYMQFRNMLGQWLRRKIFAPISRINDFYDYENDEKILIVPEVEWNHMSLFDMGDYIANLTQLLSTQPKNVSLQTVFRSLGLEFEEEMRHIRQENIEQIIQMKEMEALQRMSLNDLRSIGDDDEIQEVQESPLPGESAYENAQPGMGGMGGGMGGMDMGMGGMGGGMGGGLGGMPMGGAPPMGGGMGGPMGGGMGGSPPGGAPL